MPFAAFLVSAAVLLLPAVGAHLATNKTYAVLKQKGSKRALAWAIAAFITTYFGTMFVIFLALGLAGGFHR